VLRQLFTESAVLAAAGVVLGVVLSTLSFGYLARLMPAAYPAGTAPDLDWRVLCFTAGITILTVLLFGGAPAIAATRLGFTEALKTTVGSSSGGARGRMRSALVVGEVTLTVVLLAAAGLLLRSYSEVLAVDPGFRPRNLLIAETVLSPTSYSELANRTAFYERVLERVNALPGVAGAGFVNIAPLMFKGGRLSVEIEGQPRPGPEDLARNMTSDRVVSAEYLTTLGVPLIGGRHLDDRDRLEAPPAAVINQTMARRHWPDESAVGRRFKFGGPDTPWFTVVGVVGDVRQMGLDVPADPEFYLSVEQIPINVPFLWPKHLVVRTEGDPMALAAAVRTAVWEVDPNQPVSAIRSMEDVFDAELANRNTQMTLVGFFAVLALVLAAVGLYGVLSYAVTQRASEIGLRMALGAQRDSVVGTVVRSALLLAAIGLALGLVGAFGLTRLLTSFLFSVSPFDPATFAAVSALILLVAVLASYVPARRAAAVDPVSVLRRE
jgi:predicted permease